VFLLCLFSGIVFAQEHEDTNAVEVSFLHGNVLPHTKDLYHLQGHADGVMLSFLKQTHGKDEWHSAYNFPDYGIYLEYQTTITIFRKGICCRSSIQFLFLNRNLELKLSQGIGYATNPYDKVENSKNKAFGSTLMANTNIGLFYKKNIF